MGQVLVAKYGQQPWILQVMEAVQAAIDRGVRQLASTQAPTANAMPGDLQQGYAMPARTAEDVIQQNPNIVQAPADIAAPNNRQLVAQGLQQDNNDMFATLARAADPAQQQLGQSLPNQPMPQSPPAVQASQSGLVLPQGVQDEGTGSGHSDNSMSWLL